MSNLKQLRWESPIKILMQSGFKTFDSQTSVISTGNVYAYTQISHYIRPWSETKNGFYVGKEGEFLKFDLQDVVLPTKEFENIVLNKQRKGSVIWYKFRTWKGMVEQPFLYVLTDADNRYLVHAIVCNSGQQIGKRVSACREILPYICDADSIPEHLRLPPERASCPDLETALRWLGSKEPFYEDGSLTDTGNIAYDKLIEISYYLESVGVVNKFNVDKLDGITNSD